MRPTLIPPYARYTTTQATPPGTPSRSITVPWIQMRGRLDEAGFAIGAKVRVRVRPGRLVLTVEK